MRVHVLRNPAGGTKRSRRAAAETIGRLRGAGNTVIELTGESEAASTAALAAAVANEEIELLYVAGGDGLVHLAIQEIAGLGVPISIAPTGTGNDFATALGIGASTDAGESAAKAHGIDLLRISKPDGTVRWVASVAITGFPADINKRANTLKKLPLGPQVYTVAAVLELGRFQRRSVDLRIDGAALTTDSAMLAIGNTRLFGGGMLPCPDASPTDGLLDFTSIEDVGRLGIIGHLIGRSGGTADRPEVRRQQATRIDIDTPGIEIWGDGEFVAVSPLTIEAVRQAVTIVGILQP